MHYSNSGYLYRFIMPQHHNWRDHGIDTLGENKADRINQQPNSKFLDSFYRGPKTHVYWKWSNTSITQFLKCHNAVNCWVFGLCLLFSFCNRYALLRPPYIKFLGPIGCQIFLDIVPVKGVDTWEHFRWLTNQNTEIPFLGDVSWHEFSFIAFFFFIGWWIFIAHRTKVVIVSVINEANLPFWVQSFH